jgi:hypothetical protein
MFADSSERLCGNSASNAHGFDFIGGANGSGFPV